MCECRTCSGDIYVIFLLFYINLNILAGSDEHIERQGGSKVLPVAAASKAAIIDNNCYCCYGYYCKLIVIFHPSLQSIADHFRPLSLDYWWLLSLNVIDCYLPQHLPASSDLLLSDYSS